MDYKEKFEDFLDKMQGLLDNAKKQGHIIVRVEDLENAFPELMESDDENKPNGGIVMEDFNDGNGFYKVNLAYLNEKQVEEIEELVKKWNPELKESEDELTWLTKYIEEEAYSLSMDIRDNEDRIKLKKLQKALAWLEKQSKQTSDKIEPKFKVGDWIIYCGKTYQITGLHNDTFTLTSCDGSYFFNNVKSTKEPVFHLWTIKDAKEGDVLMSRSPFIYGKQCPYGGLNWYNNNFIKASSFIFTDSPVHPATKEQRDILFQKMKESGYEWDVEKKELKKIVDEEYNGEDYGIDGLWHAQRILEKTLGSVDGYQSDDGILSHKCAITAVKKLYEQKPTEWCEEDEQYLLVCKNALAKYQTTDKWDADIISCWLENKLKAPQNRWKPSDKQITVLELASKYERVFTPKQIDILIGLKE